MSGYSGLNAAIAHTMIEYRSAAFWRVTLALCLGSFMIFANLYVPQPLLPMLGQSFGVSTLLAGWCLTIGTLTLGLSLLIYGSLSDSIGRRMPMLISMAGATLLTVMLGFIHNYPTLLVLRGIQGFCLGGLPAIAIAYMADEFSPTALTAAVGFYISANTLGGIGGRLIGGFVGDWLGWVDAFRVMAVISVICLILFAMLLPKSQHFRPQPLHLKVMLRNMVGHLRNPILLVAYLIGGFNFFIFINQYSYVTFLLSGPPHHLPSSLIGLLFLTYLSGTLASAMSGRIARHVPQPWVMALGILVFIGGSLVTLLPWLPTIVLGFFLNAFGFFLTHSTNSSWVSRQAPHSRASASSLYLVFYYIGASTGSLYLDPFWHWAGWHGVVGASLLVLMGTLGLSLWLVWSPRPGVREARVLHH